MRHTVKSLYRQVNDCIAQIMDDFTKYKFNHGENVFTCLLFLIDPDCHYSQILFYLRKNTM